MKSLSCKTSCWSSGSIFPSLSVSKQHLVPHAVHPLPSETCSHPLIQSTTITSAQVDEEQKLIVWRWISLRSLSNPSCIWAPIKLQISLNIRLGQQMGTPCPWRRGSLMLPQAEFLPLYRWKSCLPCVARNQKPTVSPFLAGSPVSTLSGCYILCAIRGLGSMGGIWVYIHSMLNSI